MPYKYKGEDISEEFVVEGFENSSFTILDDYISKTDGLESVEEKVGKTIDVAAKDAVVTSSPGQASENTELEQVDTSSELEDPDPSERDLLVFNIQETERQIKNYIDQGGEVNESDAKVLQGYKDKLATIDSGEVRKQDKLKAEAITVTNEIQGRIKNIPKEDILNIQANDYFGPVKNRNDRTTTSRTVPGMMGPTASFEPTFESDESYTKYLKETLGNKYNQYLDYKKTNEIVPFDVKNESQLNTIYNEAETKAKDKVYNNSLFNVSEDVQEYMVASPNFASGAESLEAQKFLIKEQKDTVNKNYKTYDIAKKEWESEALPLQKEAKEIKSQIDKFKFYSTGASQEQADQYNNLIQTYNSKIQKWEEKGFNELPVFLNSQAKLVNSQQKDYSKMLDDSRKALVSADLFEKNLKQDYSASARVGRVFDEFFVQSTRNFLDLTAELVLRAAPVFQPLAFLTSPEYSGEVDSLIETIQKNNKNYNLNMASKRENIPTSPSIDDIGKDGLSVWDWTSIAFQDNSATIATTLVPGLTQLKGAAGVSKAFKTASYAARKTALQNQKKLWLAGKKTVQGTFFVAETGGKYGELQTDEASRELEIKLLYSKLDNIEDLDEKTEIYSKIKELEEVEEYSLLQKAFTSYSSGATATLFETLGTLKMLEPAKNLAKQIGVKAAKKELYKQPVRFAANLTGATLAGLKSMPKNITGEIIEETLTEVSHNALDITVLGENKSMFEGINKDFLASTGLSSIGIMAPRSAGNLFNIVKSEFRTKSEIFNNQKLARELIDLNESTTLENSKQLKGRKRQILKELALSDAISLHKLRYMTADQIEEVADINRQMRQVNGKFRQLGSLGDLGEAENKRVKKQLEVEYSNLATARQEILDAKQRSNNKKAANINKALGAAARNSESEFYFGVNDFYNDVTMTQMGDGDFVSIKGEIIINDNDKFIIKYENLDKQLAKYKEKLSEKEFSKFKKEIEDGDFNAKQFGKDIIVNQPVIDRNIALAPTETSAQYASVAPLEELFHLSVAQKDIKFDSTAKNAVLEAEVILEEKRNLGVISEKDYNGLTKRFDLYRDEKDFNAEEFIAQMNNAISLGAINRSDLESTPSFKKFLNNTIRSTFGDMSWMLSLENSDDVFNLIKNFQADVSKGVIFQAPETEEFKTSLSEDIQNEIEALEDSYFSGDIDEYQFEQQKEKLEKDFTRAEYAEKEINEKEVKADVVEETDSVDKIVKEATTKVFKDYKVSEKNKKIALVNEDIVKEMTALGANRVSDIKDPDVKKAIIDKLGKNNVGAVTELAKKAAATSRDLAIDKNLKIGYEEFFSGFSEELSALINSYKADVDGKKVPFGAYMNQNLPIRYGSILKKALKGKLKGSESLSSDKNIKKEVGSFIEDSSTETNTSEEIVLDRIDARKFGPAKDKVDKISNIVEVEDGERPTYKQLADKFIEPVSMELFSVPGKKIQGRATLTDAEAKSLQRLFVSSDNVRKLIKTMPPYNVATSEAVIGEQGEIIDVSKDTKGKSIGLSNKFMKQFYQPVTRAIPGISSPKGRSLGETTQGQVYELKPEFKGRVSNKAIKQIQSSVGVTEAGVPNEKISADNRTKYGTTLTGFARTYVSNVINIAGRSKLTDKQAQADAAAGKSDMMLSKADKSFLDITGKEAKINFNDKKIVKKLKQDVFSILGDSGLGNFNEEDFVKYLLPLATKGYDYRFKTIDGKRVLVDNSKNTRNVIFQGRKDFFKSYNEYRKSKGLKNIKWEPRARTITFKDSSGQKKTIKLATLKNQSAIGLNSGKFIETLDDRVLTAQDQRNGLKIITVALKKFADENPSDITTVPMFLTMLNSNTSGLVRTAAIPKWIMYKEGLKDSDYVYEHTQTASDTIVELMRAIYKSKNNAELLTEFDNIMKNFDVAIIPKENDSKVNIKFRYNGDREGGVSKGDYSVKIKYPGEDGFPTRYEAANRLDNAGIKLQSLADFAKSDKDVTLGKLNKAEKINLDKAFNDILENKSGIPSRKRYGIVEAITKGSSKGRFNFFIPPSAEDFVGLLYPTLGKGELGDAQMSWYKKNLIDPYAEGMNKISKARVYMMNTYDSLKKQLDVVPKDLAKKIEGTDYTKEQAVRVYIWNKQKMNIPGISDADVSELVSYVADDANLQTFGDQLINMQMGDGYVKPKEGWPAGTITTDILEGLNTTKRAKYLKNWQENVDAIFSEENLNKLQAIYGLNYRKALVNVLKRMKSGRNRDFPGDSLTGRFTDWTTGSVGTIMFLNTRSAVLQTISAINFVNFTDNNILAAGKAFANQKQYWADFMKLMNSDFLKERRGGLRINVNEADIAEMAKKGGVKGAISKLLELGFAPTQIADSFAIASGGSAFYRNRINTYLKQKDANGNNVYTEKQAEKKAFEDFRETAEESQQSSRADRISMQQASPLGRVVLAFANTPAQYARIIKKAASDLKNGRGDRKENISKIIYYGFAQNLIFNALQQALFAVGFGDDEAEDKEKEKKYVNIANGMLDSILRGSGIGGAIVSVGKNAVIKIIKELEKDRPKLQNIAAEVLKISPPISAKYSRLVQAGKSYDWNKDQMREKGLSLDNPAYLAGGNVLSALTNIPLDRVIKKANNVVAATSQDLETWERLALLAGWQQWEIGIKEEKKKKKKGRLKSNKLKIKKLDL